MNAGRAGGLAFLLGTVGVGNRMDRRAFLKKTAVAAGASAAAVAAPALAHQSKTIKWKMVTAWPRNFPGLGTGANALAKRINAMSGGRLRVKVYGAKELVGAFEVFDAVSRGTAQMGHGSPYYWKGKNAAFQFFSAIPYGLTAQETNAWLYHGGGLAIWEELYRPFGLVPTVAGNTGSQMGGWFNKEINSVADLTGLKMRIPGLGGEVLKRAGGVPVSLPGGEIFPALQSGAIDATEWVGPYNDLAFGLYKAAKYYYFPGWHEPSALVECMINQKALKKLPRDLREIVLTAAKAANMDMLSDFTAKNNQALDVLVNQHKVRLRAFPTEVLMKMRGLSDQVVAEVAAKDPLSQKAFDSFRAFRKQVASWHNVSERAYLNARG